MRSLGLRGRSILASVLVAAVAILATALLTMNATRDTLEEEQVRVADVDQEIVERLLARGRSTSDWGATRALLERLAESSDRQIVLTDLDGRPLAASSRADAGVVDPSAVLDPLTSVLAEIGDAPPTTYDTPTLPALLVEGRPGASAVRIDARTHPAVAVCYHASLDGSDNYPPGLPEPVGVRSSCADLDPGPATGGTPAERALVDLHNAVALQEHRCLRRRAVPSQLVELLGGVGTGDFTLLTVHVPPPEWIRDGLREEAARAWSDCATATLTRLLEPVVAPSALLYLTETRTTSRSLVERLGGSRILLGLGSVLLVAVVASLLASRQVLRPVRQLTAATGEMADGRLATRVEVSGGDEVAGLGRSFNAMAEALAASAEQRRRMVGDVAHELRTPLANIRAHLEAGHDGVLPRDDSWTASLLEEALLLQHVVDDLQVLAEADAGRLDVHPDSEDLVATVDAAILALRGTAEARGVALERSGDDDVACRHDRMRLRQVVGNLLSNAVRHSPDGSTVTVDVRRTDDLVRIVVRDRGDGIPAEHLPHVFERFYRVDPSRARETGGSGLGLAIVEQLVRSHGGTVSAANAVDGGAAITVELPAR